MDFIKDFKHGEVIFVTKFGSHLYGTSTENSDTDYKGVFIAPVEDIILGKVKEVHRLGTGSNKEKNTKDDTDIEMIEIRKFLNDLVKGQTYAIDMVFAPLKDAFFKLQWIHIQENRKELITSDCSAFMGYCMRQAAKYGIKGSKLYDIISIMSTIEGYDKRTKIRDHMPLLNLIGTENFATKSEVVSSGVDEKGEFLMILEKKFYTHFAIDDVWKSLETAYKKYGNRSVLAMQNDGVDWKAISHAYRACFQIISLHIIGEIIFPLEYSLSSILKWVDMDEGTRGLYEQLGHISHININSFLLKVKSGEIGFHDVQEDLPNLTELARRLAEESVLPSESIDIKDLVLSMYNL